jgi:hypothetical protein
LKANKEIVKKRVVFPNMKIRMQYTEESDDEYNGEIWPAEEVCPCFLLILNVCQFLI